MANTINSPNMTLPIPVVGVQSGPQYATDLNACLTLLDAHDHTPGSGVAITPAALDINANLTLQGNFLTNAAGVTLTAQGSTPAVNTIYQSGLDLYFVDGDGNNVQITSNGAVAGTPGSIANLLAPASAAYVSASSTFVWESNTGIAADMDFGSAKMRNLSPNSTYALTLAPPTLSSNYTITLPPLPASQKIMTIDASGTITAPYVVDNSTIAIESNVIKVPTSGITATQIAPDAVTTAKILNDAITVAKMGFTPQLKWTSYTSGSGTWTAPAEVNTVFAVVVGGGGGGGSGVTEGGCGGGAGVVIMRPLSVTPGTYYSYSVGGGGAGATSAQVVGSNGTATVFSSISAAGGIAGRSSGAQAGPGAQFNITTTGGRGGAGLALGGAGGASAAGTDGTANTGGGGGGGSSAGAGNFSGGDGGSGVIFLVWVENS
jgi:hypothetical protein